MKLTDEDVRTCPEKGQLIVDRTMKQKKQQESEESSVQIENKSEIETESPSLSQGDMGEDNSVVSAYREGDGGRAEFEKKMVLKRQEMEKKKMKNGSNSNDDSVDCLIQGVRDCRLSKEEKNDDELTGKLSRLTLKTTQKRHEPREDDEREEQCPQTDEKEEVKEEENAVTHVQRWVTLEEPSPHKEPVDEKVNMKLVERSPMGGVPVFPNRNNTDFNNHRHHHHHQHQHQQQTVEPNWIHHQQLLQQQLQQHNLPMPHNFPNYPQHQQTNQYAATTTGAGLVQHSKRGFDCEMREIYSEAPKYVRPQQMPQNNLDAPGTPLSPTSCKPVSTVCTKQMAGATVLQQEPPPPPAASLPPPPQTLQQQQHQHPHQLQQQHNWKSEINNYQQQLHHLQQQQQQQQQQEMYQQQHRGPQQQLQHHQQQQPPLPSSVSQLDTLLLNSTDLDSDLNVFLEQAVESVVDDDDDAFNQLLSKALEVHKNQDEATIQKDLEDILPSTNKNRSSQVPITTAFDNGMGLPPPQQQQQQQQQQHFFLPNTASSPSAPFNNSNIASIISQKRNSQEDIEYSTDQSPSPTSASTLAQYSPGPQSVMEASPAASSGIGTSPPHQAWSPPPSNLSMMSQDSGVCSPMSEDGKNGYGQISGGIDGDDELYYNKYVNDHLEELKDAVSVVAADVKEEWDDACGNGGSGVMPGQQMILHQQQQQQLELRRQQQQQQQQLQLIVSSTITTTTATAVGGVCSSSSGGGVLLKENVGSPTAPITQVSAAVTAVTAPPPYRASPPLKVQGSLNNNNNNNVNNNAAIINRNNLPLVTQPSHLQQQQQNLSQQLPITMTTTNTNNGGGGVCHIINNNNIINSIPTTTININNNNNKMLPKVIHQNQTPTALVFTTTNTAPGGPTPTTAGIATSLQANPEGKMPIPPTPRRNQKPSQSMFPVGVLFMPQLQPKPRFPNIAPKDPTRQTSDANGSSTSSTTTTTTTNNHNSNNTVSVNGPANLPPAMYQVQAPNGTATNNNNTVSMNGPANLPPAMYQVQAPTGTATNNNNNNTVSMNGPANLPPAMYQVQAQNGTATNNNSNNNNHPQPPPPGPNPPAAPNQQNRVISQATRQLNCARRSVAKLVREDLEFTDPEGDTNLHVAVCRTDKTDPYLIQALLERLVRENLTSMINAQNHLGQTPLYLAVSSNDSRKVKVLVDKGADTSLYAEYTGYNNSKETMAAIHIASSKGQAFLDTLKALLTAPGIMVDQVNSQGQTALNCAILCHGSAKGDNQVINSLPIIEALVRAGANPNLQVQNGHTALMFALETGNLDLFEKLFSLVEPENREKSLKIQDSKCNSVLRIAERLKATLNPVDQQRLHNCLKRSTYQRSSGGVMGGGGSC